MRNILILLFLFHAVLHSTAQDPNGKKIQGGLVFGSGLNFQKSGTRRIAEDGIGTNFTVGANIIYKLNESMGFQTGIEFDFDKVHYEATNHDGLGIYYYYSDTKILPVKEMEGVNLATSNNKLFQLTERTHQAIYLTLPTMLVFRTKFIGYTRYFGKFGLRNSFLLSNKMNDKGFNFTDNSFSQPIVSNDQNDMKARSELFFFKSAVGIAGGTEWNFSGTSTITAELGFYYGFTPLHTNRNIEKGNNYLFATTPSNGTNAAIRMNNQATQTQLLLKIAILF
jgi:hypothetical protein